MYVPTISHATWSYCWSRHGFKSHFAMLMSDLPYLGLTCLKLIFWSQQRYIQWFDCLEGRTSRPDRCKYNCRYPSLPQRCSGCRLSPLKPVIDEHHSSERIWAWVYLVFRLTLIITQPPKVVLQKDLGMQGTGKCLPAAPLMLTPLEEGLFF